MSEPPRKRAHPDQPEIIPETRSALQKKYTEYATKVNRGLQEGQFQERDLTEHTTDAFLLKYKNREPFTIKAGFQIDVPFAVFSTLLSYKLHQF